MNLGCLPNSLLFCYSPSSVLGRNRQGPKLNGRCTSTWCHMVVTCATPNLSVKLSTTKSPLFPAVSQATKMNTKSPEKQILYLYFLMSGLPFSAMEQHQSFCLSQSDRVTGHTSAALQQDLLPKHPKPATSAGCLKAQNITFSKTIRC